MAQSMAIGSAIEDLVLIVECATPEEHRNPVGYLPLRERALASPDTRCEGPAGKNVRTQKSDNVPFRSASSTTGSTQRGSSLAGEFTSVLTG
jgi:hypothetical protein